MSTEQAFRALTPSERDALRKWANETTARDDHEESMFNMVLWAVDAIDALDPL